MARLGGRVAVIRVGAATETELAERMHRVQDAVQATRAALHEGILPGGGVALLNAAGGDRDRPASTPDEATGAEVVRRALEEPLRQIARNAGFDPSVVVGDGPRADARRGLRRRDRRRTATSFEAGIIDPTLVTRSALEHAASIAQARARDRVRGHALGRARTTSCARRRELNDTAHQVVHRPPRDLRFGERGARDAAWPASTRSPTPSG